MRSCSARAPGIGWRICGSTATAILAGVCVSCGPGGDRHEPVVQSVLLITIDTLRGDCIGASGHPDVRTPNLDRLAREGVQFAEAFSASPTTLPSHTSILTGAWPTSHGVPNNFSRVPDEVVTLPEMLSSHGFARAAFVSSAGLDAPANLSQGFDLYNFRPVSLAKLDQPWRPGANTVQRAATWWERTAGRKFLWVHLFEPHAPYEPLAPYDTIYDPDYEGAVTGSMEQIFDVWADPRCITDRDHRHLVSLYLGEISTVDAYVGQLLRTLEADSSAAVILTADHGESLGERGMQFKHGFFVYPTEVHVPLLVRGGKFHRGLSNAIVRTIDIPGTILSMLGVEEHLPPEAGRLDEWIGGGEGNVAVAFASMPWEQASPVGFANAPLMRVARTDRVAYVETPWRHEIAWFDRTNDPGEFNPLASAPSPSKMLEDDLTRLISDAVASPVSSVTPQMDRELRSLGYVN